MTQLGMGGLDRMQNGLPTVSCIGSVTEWVTVLLVIGLSHALCPLVLCPRRCGTCKVLPPVSY
jgi:hypothetical protein